MNKGDHNDRFDKDLKGLEHFSPSMRFAKNVVEQVQLETELLRPQKGPLYWIPRICVAGFGLVVLVFTVILATNGLEIDFASLVVQNRQLILAILGVGLAVPGFLVLDRLLKKLMLS